ncbi:MAG TPA: sulfatase [Candidatus Bathyarchaeia archaeon]|nr:sulfatase [Candidatus Bathyarchaeia archaeon]
MSGPSRAGIAGAGLAAGFLAGAIVGTLRVVRSEDLEHGMKLLAALRAVPPVLAGTAYGGMLGLALMLLFPRARGRAAAVSGSLACLAGSAFLFFGPIHPVPAELARDRPKLAMAALAAMAALWSLPWAAAWLGGRLAGVCRALGGLLGVAAVAAGLVLPVVSASRAKGRPSVIVVSLDTMRADALGQDTPKLERLAAEGVVFERAIAPAPWTLPSHASIFTSRLPFDHGACFSRQKIRDPLVTLAEAFRDAGYRTAGFTGDAYLDATFGFDQGFERYDAIHEDQDLAAGPRPIAEAALAWIREKGDSPFFAFVHTYEPHSPYTEATFADERDRGRLPKVVDFPVVEKIHAGFDLDDAERRYVKALYRGDIARTDTVLGGLLETLRSEGILDRTIVVVLSDHGEDFWDHDMRRSPGHGHSVYEELLHVPLFVRAPGTVPADVRVRTPFSLIDVAPTLVELCGLPPVAGFQGRSIAAALRDGREPDPVPVWSESVEYGPDRFAIRGGRYKAIVVPRPDVVHGEYTPVTHPLELYDVETDPLEQVNLAGAAPEEARALVALVADRARRKIRPGTDDALPADSSDELLKTLRSLGYVK